MNSLLALSTGRVAVLVPLDCADETAAAIAAMRPGQRVQILRSPSESLDPVARWHVMSPGTAAALPAGTTAGVDSVVIDGRLVLQDGEGGLNLPRHFAPGARFLLPKERPPTLEGSTRFLWHALTAAEPTREADGLIPR